MNEIQSPQQQSRTRPFSASATRSKTIPQPQRPESARVTPTASFMNPASRKAIAAIPSIIEGDLGGLFSITTLHSNATNNRILNGKQGSLVVSNFAEQKRPSSARHSSARKYVEPVPGSFSSRSAKRPLSAVSHVSERTSVLATPKSHLKQRLNSARSNTAFNRNFCSDMAVSYRNNMRDDEKIRNVAEQNSEKNIEKGKYRSSVLELEVKLAEKLKSLEMLGDMDEESEESRRRQLRVYVDILEEIIRVSPYGSLLRQIKEAFEKSPSAPSSVPIRKSYENAVLKFSQAAVQAKNFKEKSDRLVQEVDHLKTETFSLGDTIKKLRKDLKEAKLAKQILVEKMNADSGEDRNLIKDLPPFDYETLKMTEDEDMFAIKYRERKHLLQTEILKSRFREQALLRELNLLMFQAGEIERRSTSFSIHDSIEEEIPDNVTLMHRVEPEQKSVISTPHSILKIQRLNSKITTKQVVGANTEDDAIPATDLSTEEDGEREGLSMRERILARVRKERSQMETQDEDSDAIFGRSITSATDLLRTHFSIDMTQIRSNNLNNEEQLLRSIADYSTTDSLTFRSEHGYSDDEDTVRQDDISSQVS